MIRKRTSRRLGIFSIIAIFVVILSLVTASILVSRNIITASNNPGQPNSGSRSESLSQFPKPGPLAKEVDVTITTDQLNAILETYAGNVVERPHTSISSKGISLSGRLKSFFGWGFSAILFPSVTNNEVDFQVVEAKAWVFDLPDWANKLIGETVSRAIANAAYNNLMAKKASLSDNELVITVSNQ